MPRVRVAGSDDDSDAPLEETWWGRRHDFNRDSPDPAPPTGPSHVHQPAAVHQHQSYPGDPTEEQVIENVRNLPDPRTGGKVHYATLSVQSLTIHYSMPVPK